jgi:polyisoprenyl-teichoic acid--peptidoglycan teichoic acid transferase
MLADRVTLCPAAWLHGFVGEGGLREPDVLPGGGTSWDRWGVQVPHGRFRRARRPLLAAVLSCLLPGAGQLYLGRRRRGWTMLAITAGCVAMAVGLLSEPAAVSRMLVEPGALLGLLLADVGLLVFRAVAVVDAYLLATRRRLLAPPGRVRRSAAVGLVAILALTAAPHAAAAFYDLKAYDLLTAVFSGSDFGWKASGRGAGEASQPVTAIPGRVTVLLLGGDAGPDRQGLRTDTMIVASFELKTGKASLFGLPRNLVRVPLPAGPAADFFDCRCFPRPLNELYAFAERERPDLFPHSRRPGVLAVAGAAESLLGLPIDHYALVDLKGFVDVVDALGGVTVEVPKPVRVEVDRLGTGGSQPAFQLQPGRRHLNGFTALAYVRSRKTTSDYDRMQRQRCLLSSLASQTDPAEMLRAFPRLVNVVKRSIATDIPASHLPALLEAAGGHRAQVSTVGFTPPRYATGWSAGYPIPDVRRIQRTVRGMLRLPGATAGKSGDGATASGTGGQTATTRAKASAQRAESCRTAG